MAGATRLDGSGNLVRRIANLRGKYRHQPKATVGYSMDYAVYVHENLAAFHPVGRAKFLESAVRANRAEAGRRVRTSMRRGGVTLREAVLEAGLFLQKKSQELCPVDTGALRASAFTKVE